MTNFTAARSLRARYILGLTVIALLITASYMTVQRIVSEQRNFAKIINLAGHQAGLSNRIAYFAGLMATTEDETDFRMAKSQVGRTINKMAQAHDLLRKGDNSLGMPVLSNEHVRMIYEDPMVGLDTALERYLERARAVYRKSMDELSTSSVEYIFLTTYGPHVLEPMFDAVVEEYEKIGREAILRIERLELIIWLAALITLLLEAFLIFRPLENRIRQTIDQLNSESSFLQHVIDSVNDPIVVLDSNLVVIRVNLAARSISRSGGELAGDLMVCGEVNPTMRRSCQCSDGQCMLREVMSTGEPRQTAQCVMDADSVQHTYDVVMSPLRDALGKVTGIICAYRDLTNHLALMDELKESQSNYAHLAHHDALTGLPNRILFKDRLSQAIRDAHRKSKLLALLFIDLDGFKLINDSYDHIFGDEVLKAVANRILGILREGDTLARMGGDEFILILGDVRDADKVGMAAERLLATMREPFQIQGRTVFIGASIGISVYPTHSTGVEDLVRQADAAMYQAKDEGKNTFRFFSEDLTSKAFRRITLEADLRRALEKRQFRLCYQPQLAFASQEISGLEALVRWQHPDRGLVGPGEFMGVAEESGLIVQMGEWILKEACAQMKNWVDEGVVPQDTLVAVNISGRQFDDGGLALMVHRALEETGLPASNLELEITESTMMRSPELTQQVLTELRVLGVKIAIDDFGTGYSSLSHLKLLPLTKLKIDKSFVSDIPGGSNDVAIARAIILMAKSLSLEVLAEGIETEEQLAFLRKEGCDLGQGYLFAKPMRAENIPSILQYPRWKEQVYESAAGG
jgi:diguanylate cyclase (GGDEF)-like protein